MAERGDIQEIRERVDMVELVGAKVELKRSGKSYKGLCPFHSEKRPSFYVYPESGNYVCFTCGEKGDAFTWLQKQEGMDFPDALEYLASRTSVTLKRGVARDPQRDEERERVWALNEEAATFYANILLNMPAGESGRRYVAERGLTRETIERFTLGFAPEGWDALTKYLVSRGHTEAQLVAAGLATENEERKTVYDRFRARLLFPIRNRDGKIVGFGGRILGEGVPKYLNTAQTAVFDKSANLYGIDLAKEAIRKADSAVIVEGYMDAIMAHQVGHANVVASMGTALTESQVGLLKRMTSRIILALDADAAGQAAMLRGIETMRSALDYDQVATVDARALVRFERKLSTDILVLNIPDGKDPDEFLRAHPGDWPTLVAAAEPLLDFVLRSVIGQVDLADPRAKSAAVTQLAPLIRELPDRIQQDHYTGLLARMLRLNEQVVASEIQRLALVRPNRSTSRGATSQLAPAADDGAARLERGGTSREDHLIGLCLRYPELAAELGGELGPSDLTATANRLIWEAIYPHALANPRLRADELIATIGDESLREGAEALVAALGERAETFPGPIRQEFRETLRHLRQEQHETRLKSIQQAIHEAAIAGDQETLVSLTALLPDLLATKRSFDPPKSPYFRDMRTPAERR